jgi:vitamin B12 transporter
MRLRLPARRFALSVSIVPMLHATAVMAQALPVSPQNPSVPVSQTDTNRLDPVNVTATRIPSRVSDTIAETTVIDRTDIDRATGRTFTELLSRQPGIQFTNTGGLGQFSSVYIRGMRAQSTLLLVDGVPMGDVDFNLPSMSNIALDSIDRVEIVRGPLSSLYGSQAMGGVIQVFTRQAREGFSPNASATVGSNQYYQISGGAAFGQGPFNGAVQLSRVSTNAFSAAAPNELFGFYNPDRDPFIQNSGNLRLGWQLNSDWRIEGSAMSAQASGAWSSRCSARLHTSCSCEKQAVRVEAAAR